MSHARPRAAGINHLLIGLFYIVRWSLVCLFYFAVLSCCKCFHKDGDEGERETVISRITVYGGNEGDVCRADGFTVPQQRPLVVGCRILPHISWHCPDWKQKFLITGP